MDADMFRRRRLLKQLRKESTRLADEIDAHVEQALKECAYMPTSERMSFAREILGRARLDRSGKARLAREAGFTVRETAELLGVSQATICNDTA